jgi:hypothetical protein
MTLGFMDMGEQGLAVLIPREIVDLLEWKEGDAIVADIPMTGSELVLHRRDSPTNPTISGPSQIITPGAVKFPGSNI